MRMAKVENLQEKLLSTMILVGFIVLVEIVTVCILSGGAAYAATQGALGATSIGSLLLTVRKTASAGISGLRDMTANLTESNSDLTWSNDVCVFSTNVGGSYTIKATGSQGNGTFALSDGAKVLPYNVLWNDGGAGNLSNSGVLLQPGVTSHEMTKAATDSANCNGASTGPTARLIINIPAANIRAADVGNYTESLTLIVSPS